MEPNKNLQSLIDAMLERMHTHPITVTRRAARVARGVRRARVFLAAVSAVRVSIGKPRGGAAAGAAS